MVATMYGNKVDEAKAHKAGHAEKAKAENARLAARVAELEGALAPLASLKLPAKPKGNAGMWSLFHSDIQRAKNALSSDGSAIETAIAAGGKEPTLLDAVWERADRERLATIEARKEPENG